jgi:hypothetical protein
VGRARPCQAQHHAARFTIGDYPTCTLAEAEIIFAILGIAAKLERGAKAKGVRFGHALKLTPHQKRDAQARLLKGDTQRTIARSYNVGQAAILRLPPQAATAEGSAAVVAAGVQLRAAMYTNRGSGVAEDRTQ